LEGGAAAADVEAGTGSSKPSKFGGDAGMGAGGGGGAGLDVDCRGDDCCDGALRVGAGAGAVFTFT